MFSSSGRKKVLLFMGTDGRECKKNTQLSLPLLGMLKLFWVGTIYLKMSYEMGQLVPKL